jgi:hypothetical protein
VGEPYRQDNQVYFGDGAGGFKEASPTSREPLRSSRGTAVVDLDDDGALDVVVNNMSEPADLYQGRSGGGWIRFRLVGVKTNRDGLGVVVSTKVRENIQRTELRVSDGFQGSNEPIVHVGLGDITKVDEVTVSWPSRVTQLFRDLAAGKVYVIKEGVGILVP